MTGIRRQDWRILCSRCNRVVRVGGREWQHRIRYARLDARGNYLGYNCDDCADHIEAGIDENY